MPTTLPTPADPNGPRAEAVANRLLRAVEQAMKGTPQAWSAYASLHDAVTCALRIYSDHLFLTAVRQWRPANHGDHEDQPFPATGAIPETLALRAMRRPGLAARRTWDQAAADATVHLEIYPSHEAARTSHTGELMLRSPGDQPTPTPTSGHSADVSTVDLLCTSAARPGQQPDPVEPAGARIAGRPELSATGTPVVAVDQDAITRCARKEVPLGMPPPWWPEWRSSLLAALEADQIDPTTVDIRLVGSAAGPYPWPRRPMPTPDSVQADLRHGRISRAVNGRAIASFEQLLGRGTESVPVPRPFDALYRLGLGDRSDYDINLSSDGMFRRALARWNQKRYGGRHPSGRPMVPLGPEHSNHGYLNKDLVADEFPNLHQWAKLWTIRLGRAMSYAVFLSGGPEHTTTRHGHAGLSVHHRDTDWIIQAPRQRRRVQPHATTLPPQTRPAGSLRDSPKRT